MAEKRSNPDQFQLRLPPGMRQAIKLVAEANNRSLNAEIVSQLAGGGIRETLVQQKDVLELSVDISNMASEILTQTIAEMKGQQAISRAALPVLKDIRDLQGEPSREDLERIGNKIEELIKTIVTVTEPAEQAAKTLVDRLYNFSHELAARVRS